MGSKGECAALFVILSGEKSCMLGIMAAESKDLSATNIYGAMSESEILVTSHS